MNRIHRKPPGRIASRRLLVIALAAFVAGTSLRADRPRLVSVFETGSGTAVLQILAPALNVPPLSWAPDGRGLLAADEHYQLLHLEIVGDELVRVPTRDDAAENLPRLWTARWSPDGKQIVEVRSQMNRSGSTVLVRSATNGAVRLKWTDAAMGIADAVFNADGKQILTLGNEHASVTWWDAASGGRLGRRVELWAGSLRVVTLATNDTPTTWWDHDRGARELKAPTGQALHPGYNDQAVLVRGGKRLLVLGSGGWARLWDLERGSLVWMTRSVTVTEPMRSCVWSPEGTRLFVPQRSQVWDSDTLQTRSLPFQEMRTVQVRPYAALPPPPLITVRRPFTVKVEGAAFSPDGKLLLTWQRWGNSGDVYLWRLDTGQLVRKISVGRVRGIELAAFSPDGTRIVTVGSPF